MADWPEDVAALEADHDVEELDWDVDVAFDEDCDDAPVLKELFV